MNSALITGASSGIGRATALALAERGVKLALLARSADKLAAVAHEALQGGAKDVLTLVGDIRDEQFVTVAVGQMVNRFGEVGALVNSAGLSLNGTVDGYALADWQTVLDTNLTGTFLTCRAVLPSMKRQRGGQILNISSGAGRNGVKEMAAYSAAKFGVIGFSEALGLEVRNENIRVAVLVPGSVATNFSTVARRQAAEKASTKRASYALFAEEVAAVIVMMLSQPQQVWLSEVTVRPLNLELLRTLDE